MHKPLTCDYNQPYEGKTANGTYALKEEGGRPVPVIHPGTVQTMKVRGGVWAAYQNMDLGHSQLGHMNFLKVGPGCTFTTAPDRYPDTDQVIGWRYLHIGYVNVANGSITPDLPTA